MKAALHKQLIALLIPARNADMSFIDGDVTGLVPEIRLCIAYTSFGFLAWRPVLGVLATHDADVNCMSALHLGACTYIVVGVPMGVWNRA